MLKLEFACVFQKNTITNLREEKEKIYSTKRNRMSKRKCTWYNQVLNHEIRSFTNEPPIKSPPPPF